jgi:peptidyl-prolyl cis-trans isomerase D
MITWIQTALRKHTVAFIVILIVAVAIPFVFTIGAAPGIGRAEMRRLSQPFYDVNLGSDEEVRRIMEDAQISVWLQAGFSALSGAQLQDFALQRVAARSLADANRLPPPTEAELTSYITTLRLFQNEQGQFDAKRYAEFADELQTNPRLTEADVARVLNDDVRIRRMQEIAGGPGYVLTADVAAQVARAGTRFTIEVAEVDYSAYAPDLTPTEQDIAQFFEENGFRYEVPQRVVVDYAFFSNDAFGQRINPTETQLLDFFRANRARFPAPADEDETPAITFGDEVAEFAKVRDQVLAAFRNEQGGRRAASAASDFALRLFEDKVEAGAPNLPAIVAQFGGELRSAPPFTARSGPAGLNWPQAVVASSFRLDRQRFFSDPLNVPGGHAVLLWRQTLDPYRPMLAEVREQVVNDYLTETKRRRFVEAGRQWRAQIAARLAAGNSFAETATNLPGAPAFRVERHADFTRRNPPDGLEFAVLNALDALRPGDLSDFLVTADRGYLVKVVERQVPPLVESGFEFVATRTQLAQHSTDAGQSLFFSELIERELAKGAPALPRAGGSP